MHFIKENHLSVSVFLAHYNGIDEDLKLSELRKQYNIEGILYAPLETNGLFTICFLDENKTLEQRIVQLFKDIGISSSQNGYHYLKSAIEWNVRLSIPHTKLKIMKLYPILAKQYHTTSSNIERNMRYVIEKTFLMGKFSRMLKTARKRALIGLAKAI